MAETELLQAETVEQDSRERVDRVDFKMVTFSLSGREYGIDIMKVKEIAKFAGFTYVPNSRPFVRGVYNLRGDIISIIDLRKMFHLNVTTQQEQHENGLILRLDENTIGVVVDMIDKVVGIDSRNIQPPHPIFGDVNIKYINGVVESEGRLYIILDVEKIFGKEEVPAQPVAAVVSIQAETAATKQDFVIERAVDPEAKAVVSSSDRDFVIETLQTFRRFHVSELNYDWFVKRFDEWAAERGANGLPLQINSVEDADAFLSGFYSPYTGTFWAEDYALKYLSAFPDTAGKIVSVWNPGCGKGHESYSFTALLAKKYPEHKIKLWGHEIDLLNISSAPNLVFPAKEVPGYLKAHVAESGSGGGAVFQATLKDRINFEYHDVMNGSQLPDLDIILIRDLLSFLTPQDFKRLLDEMHERLKPGGVLFTGENENTLDTKLWERSETGGLVFFRKV